MKRQRRGKFFAFISVYWKYFSSECFKDGSCWLLDSRVVKSCCKQFSNPRNSSKIVVVGHRGGLKTEKSESRVSKTLQVGEWKRTLAIKMLATDKLQKVNSEEQKRLQRRMLECQTKPKLLLLWYDKGQQSKQWTKIYWGLLKKRTNAQ